MIAAAAGSLQPEGPVAESMADLWWLMLALGTAVFVLFGLLLALALRRTDDGTRSPDDEGRRDTRWLVGGGVLLPLVVIGIVFAATLQAMRATPVAGTDDLVIEVIGHQWWYEIRYPDHGVVTANEIHLPVGRPVTFHLTSADVIHSFWVPRLGGKMDLLPERENTLTLQADRPGHHRSACAEFCGLQHARMAMMVVAEPQEDFDAWVRSQSRPAEEPATATAERGRELFVGADCVRCHSIAGATIATEEPGPDLTHLASRLTLGAGVLDNTPAALRDWLADPQAIKPGIDMPTPDLSDDEIDALASYLEGLE